MLGAWQPGCVDGTYEPEHDVAYLCLTPNIEHGSSKRQVEVRIDGLAGELVPDLDDSGLILGIEVFDASSVLRPETVAQLEHLAAP